MAIKAKHEQQIYSDIYKCFTKGKPIGELRQKLEDIDENDIFPGGYTDKNYLRKLQAIAAKEGEKMNKINISRTIDIEAYEQVKAWPK